MYALILIAYNLIFFWSFWKNPYLNHTSEIATTFFPHWIWMGRQLRQGKLPLKDSLYYKLPGSIPFLSTFYPTHFIGSFLSSFLSIDKAFKVFTYVILAHYIIGSLLAFEFFKKWTSPEAALFGSITLTYAGYMIKIQQPCIAYTIAWIPGILIGGWAGIASMAMVLYSGYYPIFIYLLPFLILFYPLEVLFGTILALPQLILFFIYFKNSVRWKAKVPAKAGRLTLGRLSQLFLPLRPRTHLNGVMFMEYQMYLGLIPIILIWFSRSQYWMLLAFGLAVVLGIFKPWQRIPARALYIVTLSISVLAMDGLNRLHLSAYENIAISILQGAILLFNMDIYPCFPFTQWWTKPSEHTYDVTGYLTGEPKFAYHGDFRLK